MAKKLKKASIFTDIHWGVKNNSEQHNQDCLNFINWFCDNIRNDPDIDHIIFLGDWHESRSSLNLATLNASFKGASLLNQMNMPVYFIVGNHDLYHRVSREVHSVPHFSQFENFILIDEIMNCTDTLSDTLFVPYIFEEEYKTLAQNNKAPIWWGHFEFKDFILTGNNIKLLNGPDPKDFKRAKRIFSGHFHKRQQVGNITYIGNTFPTTFGDANDFNRGMMVYDYETDEETFINWEECPKYQTIYLSQLIDNDTTLEKQARVKCMVDIDITHDQRVVLKNRFLEKYDLRDFAFEEMVQVIDLGQDTIVDLDKHSNIDSIIVELLDEVEIEKIDNELLTTLFKEIDK